MKINIQPHQKQIDIWIKKYVPEKDFYYLTEEDLHTFYNHLKNVLIIPKAEFLQHPTYKQVQIVNSLEYWKMSKKVQYIIVANSGWFNNLSLDNKKKLNSTQVKLVRGLIHSLSTSSSKNDITEDNIVEENGEMYVILQNDMWKKLSYTVKENLIRDYANNWESWTCYEFPEQAPLHLKKYANTFPSTAGSNCLAATLYAISQQDWIIHEWVYQETFALGLKNAHYYITNEERLCPGDVVTWVNKSGIIEHASYHIGDHLFFNKNGQTFFNPWKIVDWAELKQEWSEYSIKIYRKCS